MDHMAWSLPYEERQLEEQDSDSDILVSVLEGKALIASTDENSGSSIGFLVATSAAFRMGKALKVFLAL